MPAVVSGSLSGRKRPASADHVHDCPAQRESLVTAPGADQGPATHKVEDAHLAAPVVSPQSLTQNLKHVV